MATFVTSGGHATYRTFRTRPALEVKLTKTSTKVREVIDEINADIAAYSKLYRSLLFVVYDLGQIKDEIEFKQDVEDPGNVTVIVVKH